MILSGDELGFEFRDGGESESEPIKAGEVYWLEPTDRVHRAVNTGKQRFEEVTTFFMDGPRRGPSTGRSSKLGSETCGGIHVSRGETRCRATSEPASG